MKIGVIGLGKMGEAIVYRACRGGHTVYAFDEDEKKIEAMRKYGAKPCMSIEELMSNITLLWLMVPAGEVVDQVLHQLYPLLRADMIIVDGGNSWYKDSQRRAIDLEAIGVHYLDCGTSGGVDGKELGFSLMVGGSLDAYKQAVPLFHVLASVDGYAYMGPSGAGHYVKMIHNGIEYGLLQAYAEGMQLIMQGPFKELNAESIAQVWQHGSIIRSWIGQLMCEVLKQKPDFQQISGAIAENGTGAWMQQCATEAGFKTPMLDQSLAIRAWSRETGGDVSTQLVALLRHRFGGHQIQTTDSKES